MPKPVAETAVAVRKVKKEGLWLQAFRRLSKDKIAMAGLIGILLLIFVSVAAPILTPYSPDTMDFANMQTGPSLAHPFGTDELGRDYLTRLLYGGRYSLGLGLISSILSLAVGTVFGVVAGYFGGIVDDIISRICDIVQAIPTLLLCIIISMTLGNGYITTIFALAIGGVAGNLRLPRSQMLAIRKMEYLDAASAINCSTPRILFRHALPNIMSPMLVGFTMGIGNQVQSAASLSVLGLGVQPPTPEWGAMLSDSLKHVRTDPYLMMFPGLFIFLISLFVNMFGDGLRDALDPKLKQ